MSALGTAEGLLGGVLGRLMAVTEAYPELKADRTMRELSEELTSTENRVGFARQSYNDTVLDYNNAAGQFPANLVARLFGFEPAAMLQSTQSVAERQAPRAARAFRRSMDAALHTHTHTPLSSPSAFL